mgnify:CR=1 FL=1
MIAKRINNGRYADRFDKLEKGLQRKVYNKEMERRDDVEVGGRARPMLNMQTASHGSLHRVPS